MGRTVNATGVLLGRARLLVPSAASWFDLRLGEPERHPGEAEAGDYPGADQG
jgi:hypothetical protein